MNRSLKVLKSLHSHSNELVGMMACNIMIIDELILEDWRYLLTDICCIGAAWMESTSLWGIYWTGYFAW